MFSQTAGSHHLRFGADVDSVRENVNSETLGAVFGVARRRNPNFPTQRASTLQSLGQARLAPNLNQPSLKEYNVGLPTLYQQGFENPEWVSWSKRYNFFVQETGAYTSG